VRPVEALIAAVNAAMQGFNAAVRRLVEALWALADEPGSGFVDMQAAAHVIKRCRQTWQTHHSHRESR
jgi:hypothetical protein